MKGAVASVDEICGHAQHSPGSAEGSELRQKMTAGAHSRLQSLKSETLADAAFATRGDCLPPRLSWCAHLTCSQDTHL